MTSGTLPPSKPAYDFVFDFDDDGFDYRESRIHEGEVIYAEYRKDRPDWR